MATITSLGFSIFSRYFGGGVKAARRDLRSLDNSLLTAQKNLGGFGDSASAAWKDLSKFGTNAESARKKNVAFSKSVKGTIGSLSALGGSSRNSATSVNTLGRASAATRAQISSLGQGASSAWTSVKNLGDGSNRSRKGIMSLGSTSMASRAQIASLGKSSGSAWTSVRNLGNQSMVTAKQVRSLGLASDSSWKSVDRLRGSSTNASTAVSGLGNRSMATRSQIASLGSSSRSAWTSVSGLGGSSRSASTNVTGLGNSAGGAWRSMSHLGTSTTQAVNSQNALSASSRTVTSSVRGSTAATDAGTSSHRRFGPSALRSAASLLSFGNNANRSSDATSRLAGVLGAGGRGVDNFNNRVRMATRGIGGWVVGLVNLAPALVTVGAAAGVVGGAIAAGAAAAGTGVGVFAFAMRGAIEQANSFYRAGLKLTAQQKIFVKAEDKATYAYLAFIKATRGDTLAIATRGMKALTAVFNQLPRVVKAFFPVFDTFAARIQKWAEGNGLKRFLNYVDKYGPPIFNNLGNAGVHVLQFLGQGFRALLPFAEQVTHAIERGAQALANWGANGGFQRILAYVKANASTINNFFKQLGIFIAHLGEAMAGLGPVMLLSFGTLLKLLNALPIGVLQALIVGFYALKAAMLITTIVNGLAAAMGVVSVMLGGASAATLADATATRALGFEMMKNAILAVASAVKTAALAVAHGVAAAATAAYGFAVRLLNGQLLISLARTIASTAATVAYKVVALAVRVATLAWTAAQWLLNAALLANPIGLIVLAVAALVAVIVVIATKTTWFQQIWAAAWPVIKTVFMAVWNTIKAAALAIWNSMKIAWTAFTAAFKLIWDAVKAVFTGDWSRAWTDIKMAAQLIWTGIKALWQGFVNAFKIIWDAAKGPLTAAWNAVWNAMKAAAQIIWNAITAAWRVMVNGLAIAFNAVKGALMTAWTVFWNAMKAAGQVVWNAITAAWRAVVNGLTTAFNAVKGALTTAWTVFWNGLKTAAQVVWTAMTAAWRAVVTGLSTAFNAVKGVLTTAWTAFWNGLKTVAQAVWNAMVTAWRTVVNTMNTVFTAAANVLRAGWQALWSGVQNIARAVWDWIIQRTTALAAFFLDKYNAIKTAVSNLWNATWSFVQEKARAIWDWIIQRTTALAKFFLDKYNAIKTAVMNLWNQTWSFVQSKARAVWDWIIQRTTALASFFLNKYQAIKTAVVNLWNQTWSAVQNTGRRVWDWIIDRMRSLRDFLVKAVTDAVNGMHKAWLQIKGYFASPVRFVIDTVINGGLLKALNWVLDKLGFKSNALGNVKVKGFATGGQVSGGAVSGPGTSKSDSIPIAVSDGEYIMRARAAKQIGYQNLGYMNSTGRMPGYAYGGKVSPWPHVSGVDMASLFKPDTDDGILGFLKDLPIIGDLVEVGENQADIGGKIISGDLKGAFLQNLATVNTDQFKIMMAASNIMGAFAPGSRLLKVMLKLGLKTVKSASEDEIQAFFGKDLQGGPAGANKVMDVLKDKVKGSIPKNTQMWGMHGSNDMWKKMIGKGIIDGPLGAGGKSAKEQGKALTDAEKSGGGKANGDFMGLRQVFTTLMTGIFRQMSFGGLGFVPFRPWQSGDGAHVSWHGVTLNKRSAEMMDKAQGIYNKLGPGGSINAFQGSYNSGVSASAGTHDGGGAIDVGPASQALVGAMRASGWAAWLRGPEGGSPSFSPHVHGIAVGDPTVSPAAADPTVSPAAAEQVQQFMHGQNGLANHGPDNYKPPKAYEQFVAKGVGGTGVQRWAGLAAQVLAMVGISASQLGAFMALMAAESSGDPNANNDWDSNAQRGNNSRGLMQVTPETFAAFHWPGTSGNILDPIANMAASANYIKHVYGGIVPGSPYANGTSGVTAGWHIIGERGPEMVRLPGGSSVSTNKQLKSMISNSASQGSGDVSIPVNITVEGNMDSDAAHVLKNELVTELRQLLQKNVGRR